MGLAGAVIADPEFVQFHPTAMDLGGDPAPLATEALRGEGARLVNADGAPFMARYHRAAELAPQTPGIDRELGLARYDAGDCEGLDHFRIREAALNK